jgi:hypothetical protein
MLYRIGTSSLLIKKTYNLIIGNNRALAKSCKIVQTWPSLLHLLSVSIIRRKENGNKGLFSFINFNGQMISSRHYFKRDKFAISLRSLIISQICI